MSTVILDQIVEYDKSAGAWGQYAADGEIVHYHDSQAEAILAALPEELRRWVAAASIEYRNRTLRAAVLIAEDKVKADTEAYGIYHVASTRTNNGMTYAVEYTIDARAHTCNCLDHQYNKCKCKHLLAAERLFSQFKAEHLPRQASLWELAQAAVKEHKHDMNFNEVIWRNLDNTRQATITRIQSDTTASRGEGFVDALYLSLSGHALRLRIAVIHYDVLGLNGDDWRWTCRQDEYKAWVKEINR